MYYEELLRRFSSRRKGMEHKRLSSSLKLKMNDDKSLSVMLYSTPIITRFPNNDVEIRTDGWLTRTTHRWLLHYAGVIVRPSNSGLTSWRYENSASIWSYPIREIHAPNPLNPDKTIRLACAFYEGMRINKQGEIISKSPPQKLIIQNKDISNKAKKLMQPMFELRRIAKELGDDEDPYKSNPRAVAMKILSNQEINYDEARLLTDHDIDMVRYDVRHGLGDAEYTVELEEIGNGQYRWNRVE